MLRERPEPLDSASTAGGKLFATYIKDVTTRAYVHALDGRLENEIVLPGLGTATGFGGERDSTFVFFTFNSLNVPPTIYRYDLAAKKTSVFRQPKVPGYDPAAYETKQIFYTSKDGTKVPMFLVHRKGLKLDGTNPTLLYGYGGFNVVQSPTFSASRLALLEQGFVYASANMRGGGEREKWHQAGMKLKKQNVFDDFIAAAEWLIANKYVGAAAGGSGRIERRPARRRGDEPAASCSVAIPQVGVMDMLRFHKFTIGWNWVADYGSSDDADEFAALKAYSPLHNIKPGGKYPATLVTTADHDDRVVPAHRSNAPRCRRWRATTLAAHPHRNQLGSRRQRTGEAARYRRRHLLVHHVQHGRDTRRFPAHRLRRAFRAGDVLVVEGGTDPKNGATK